MKFLASHEHRGDPWEFDLTSFWTVDGEVWGATDAGCSCPMPFENHRFPESYTRITSLKALDEFFPAPGKGARGAIVDSYVRTRETVAAALKEAQGETGAD